MQVDPAEATSPCVTPTGSEAFWDSVTAESLRPAYTGKAAVQKPGPKKSKCFDGIVKKTQQKRVTEPMFRYSCIFCDNYFFKKGEYKNHIREHANNLTLKCPCCGQEYQDHNLLLDHLKTRGELSLVCHMCGFKANDKNEIKKHTTSHIRFYLPLLRTGKPLIKCKECNFKTYDEKKMFLHRFNKHIKPMSIISAGTRFKQISQKSCIDCGESFPSVHFLRRHKKFHNTGKQLFACPYCEYRSDFPKATENHLKKNHEQLRTMFKCAICNYQVPSLRVLNSHITWDRHDSKLHLKETALNVVE